LWTEGLAGDAEMVGVAENAKLKADATLMLVIEERSAMKGHCGGKTWFEMREVFILTNGIKASSRQWIGLLLI
jgi:hypothetical protein